MWQDSKSRIVSGFIVFVLFGMVINTLPVAAQSTIIVTSTADTIAVDGFCTLREAITSANTNAASNECAAGTGTDTIEFNIPGAGPHTITVTTALPTITSPVFIDGLSQSGANCQTGLMIVITASAPGSHGLELVSGSSGSTIRGLVINSFSGGGIALTNTSNNRIQCNYLGTNDDGTADLGNAHGLFVIAGATDNIFGTDGDGTNDANEGNLISGNIIGVNIAFNVSIMNNIVAGNLIGTDITGTVALGNRDGVFIQFGANNNIIGTNGDGISDALEGNLISGNTRIGVFVWASNDNTIAGNWIGTDINGTAAVPNVGSGIAIMSNSTGNIIGTNGDGNGDASEGNLVSGNTGIGIWLVATVSNNRVAGNRIGTDITGTLDLGNTSDGIILQATATNNIIGTNGDGLSDALEGNLISGNNALGLQIADCDNNIIAGNLIGTNLAGTAAIPNSSFGISVQNGSNGNTIGTNGDGISDALEGNLISGNSVLGIAIFTDSSTNIVAGNKIGTNLGGTAAIGNPIGIYLSSASNQIGTDGDGLSDTLEGNLISGNTGNGIEISGSLAIGNVIAGNIIGLQSGATAVLGNGENGIHMLQDANSNTIGGTSFAMGNRIGGNAGAGILIEGSNSPDNIISFNVIGTNPARRNLANGTNGIEIIPTVTGLTTVSNNWIFYHPVTGILLANAADLGAAGVSENNCLYQNAAGLNNTTGINRFFENNWWGGSTGPSGVGPGNGDSVSANVDFQPFLRTAPNGCPPEAVIPAAASGIYYFDPAISKLGLLQVGQTGVTGEELEWIITVSNTSTVAGQNVTITDTLNPALQIDSVDAPNATVTINGQTVTVVYATLNVGETVQFSIFTTVLEGATVTNTACVNASNQGAEECATGLAVSELPSTGEPPFWRYALLAGIAGSLLAAGFLGLKKKKMAR